MQELVNSMVKFSAAMTMFGMQQMRNTAEMAVEPQAAMKKFQASIDAVTGALGSTLDEPNKQGADKMSKVGADLVDRTWDAMNVSAFDPRELMQTTVDLLRKTTESLADLMKKATDEAKSVVGEPKPAAEALSST